MSTLVLELKQGESLMVNGATIRFKTRARIELVSRSRFMFGKQIMAATEATTPARQIYYDVQTLYVGPPEGRDGARASLGARLAPLEGELVAALRAALESEALFEALKLARQLVRQERASHAG